MIYSIVGVMASLIPLGVLGLIFYIIIRKSQDGGDGPKHAYYYLVSFVTLAILYWAFCDLLRLILSGDQSISLTSSSYSTYYNQDRFLRRIAGRLSAIIVALPLWAFHFMKVNPPKGQPIDSGSRKAYALIVVICSIIIMLFGWSVLAYYLLTWALGVPETNIGNNVFALLAYAIPATILWMVHFMMWKKLNDKTATIKKEEAPTSLK